MSILCETSFLSTSLKSIETFQMGIFHATFPNKWMWMPPEQMFRARLLPKTLCIETKDFVHRKQLFQKLMRSRCIRVALSQCCSAPRSASCVSATSGASACAAAWTGLRPAKVCASQDVDDRTSHRALSELEQLSPGALSQLPFL